LKEGTTMSAIKALQREIDLREKQLAALRESLSVLTGGQSLVRASKARKRKPMSEETKAKLRKAAKQRWKAIKSSQ
jgi:predicted  nucleic acid-binding Zn-ribbon protein